MAKRDVIQYYLEQQNVYFESLNNIKEIDDAIKKGIVTEEQFKDAQKELEIIKNNYERLSYIVLLLNKPKRKEKQLQEEQLNKKWYDALKGSSREALLDESKDALSDFKKLVREITTNDK